MTIFKYSEFESGDDFNLYFKNTLMRLIPPPAKGRPEWVYYDGMVPKGHAFHRDGPRKASSFVISRGLFNKLFKIEVKYPVGFFNTKQSAILCERVGNRQYNKGLNDGGHGNYSVVLMERLVESLVEMPAALMPGLLSARRQFNFGCAMANLCFEESQYIPLQDAVAQIRSRKFFGRALSKDFALLPHFGHKDFLILYHGMPVADLVSKELKIKIHIPRLQNEIGEFFTAQGAKLVSS